MPLSLHAAFVPSALQILKGMKRLIDKAENYAKENNIDESELLEAKLAEDMWSLPWHVRSCWVHSGYAINLFKTGEFTPDFSTIPDSLDAMRTMIDDAVAQLDALTPADLESVAGETIGFVLGGKRLMEMTGENFLLGFTQPNFYFHATTFYDILRMKGLPLGKADFMGPMRVLER